MMNGDNLGPVYLSVRRQSTSNSDQDVFITETSLSSASESKEITYHHDDNTVCMHHL